MRHIYLLFTFTLFIYATTFSQQIFSEETKKYIAYHETDLAFQNVLLIDGNGNAAKPNQTVIVSNGKITWIGDNSKAKLPKSIKIIDLDGKALLPGWIMLHEHLFMPNFSSDPNFRSTRPVPITFPRLYLACGATTIRTAGSVAPFVDLQIKREIENGNLPGPKIDLTSPFLNHAPIKTKEEGAAFVAYWADQGFTSFKGHAAVTKEVLQGAIEAAHHRNLKITGHLNRITFREAAEMHIDQLEHGFIVSTDFVPEKKSNQMTSEDVVHQSLITLDLESELVKKLMNTLIEKNIAITSTLAIWEGLTTIQPSPDPKLLSMMAPDSRDYYLRRYARTMSQSTPTNMDLAFRKNGKMEKMFADLGGLLTVGTDPTGNGGIIAGFSSLRAIELLVEMDGFSPVEAIKIATLNGAKALAMEKTTGTIEVGKNADLIIIDGDPSKDIRSIRDILYVFKDGVGYDSKKLIESVRGRVGFD